MSVGIPVTRKIYTRQPQRQIKRTENTFGNSLVNKGLYDEIEITEGNVNELADLLGGHVKIDCYCPKCKEKRVFSSDAVPYFWFDQEEKEIQKGLLEEAILLFQENQKKSFRQSAPQLPNEPERTWKWTNHSMCEDTRIMIF